MRTKSHTVFLVIEIQLLFAILKVFHQKPQISQMQLAVTSKHKAPVISISS